MLLEKLWDKLLQNFAHEIRHGKTIRPKRLNYFFAAHAHMTKQETKRFLKELRNMGLVERHQRGFVFVNECLN